MMFNNINQFLRKRQKSLTRTNTFYNFIHKKSNSRIQKEKILKQSKTRYCTLKLLKNGVEISNASVMNYDEIILTEILTDTQMIYQVNDIQGYSVKVNDNGKELPLLSDKGKYFYTLSDFSQSHEIDFIYTDDEAKDTIIKLYINNT